MKQNGAAPILVIVGFLVSVSLVVGFYFFGVKSEPKKADQTKPVLISKSESPAPTIPAIPLESTPNPTYGWRDYNDGKGGVHFKYPDWKIVNESEKGTSLTVQFEVLGSQYVYERLSESLMPKNLEIEDKFTLDDGTIWLMDQGDFKYKCASTKCLLHYVVKNGNFYSFYGPTDTVDLQNRILGTFKFEKLSSPESKYTVKEEFLADGFGIKILDEKGKVIAENIIAQNEKEIGYNKKFMCSCSTNFKAWVDDTHFTIKIVNGGGEEYEITVDATNGKADESSFKKIK